MRSGRRYTHVPANNSKKTWTGRPSSTSSTHATPMGKSALAGTCARTKRARRQHQPRRGGAGPRKKMPALTNEQEALKSLRDIIRDMSSLRDIIRDMSKDIERLKAEK